MGGNIKAEQLSKTVYNYPQLINSNRNAYKVLRFQLLSNRIPYSSSFLESHLSLITVALLLVRKHSH